MIFLLSVSLPAGAEMPVTLQVKPMEKDKRGTDVRLIREITVDVSDKQYAKGPYDIIYYVDGRGVEAFNGRKLPFSFLWNFKGLKDGTYGIRLEVVQPGEKPEILGEAETTVEVVHRQTKENKNNGGSVSKLILPPIRTPEEAMAQLEVRRQALQNVGKEAAGVVSEVKTPAQKPLPDIKSPSIPAPEELREKLRRSVQGER